MACIFILTLLLLTISFALCKLSRISFIFLILTTTSFWLISSGIFPFLLVKNLESWLSDVSTPKWQSSNAIILLGSGNVTAPWNQTIIPSVLAYSRISKTASLYLSCRKSSPHCVVIISGGNPISIGKSEATVYQAVLLELGVKNSDIITERRSMNTYQNAEFTTAILAKHQFKQILLVTSGLHMQRALLYFANFGIHAIPAPADYIAPRITVLPSTYNFLITDLAVHECLGMVKLYIYNYFGWNKKMTTAGAV